MNFVINGGFDTIEKIEDILSTTNSIRQEVENQVGKTDLELEGCMSGRLAMNNPWEIARVDRELYNELDFHTNTREEIIREYADFC